MVTTLSVLVRIMALTLSESAARLPNEINRFSNGLTFVLGVLIRKLVDTTNAVGRCLCIVIGELVDVIDELLCVDLINAISEVAGHTTTELDAEVETVSGSLDATATVRVDSLDGQAGTTGRVGGKPSKTEQQKRIRLPSTNNPIRKNSYVRPKKSTDLRRTFPRRSTDPQTVIEREEIPQGKLLEISTCTSQTTVVKVEELTHDNPTATAKPIVLYRIDKKAEWRRKKFFRNYARTVTAGEIVRGNYDRTMERRGAWADDRGLAKWPFAGPAPVIPANFQHTGHGSFANPPILSPVHFWHGPPGPMAAPPYGNYFRPYMQEPFGPFENHPIHNGSVWVHVSNRTVYGRP